LSMIPVDCWDEDDVERWMTSSSASAMATATAQGLDE
jgi:hypothetical protein